MRNIWMDKCALSKIKEETNLLTSYNYALLANENTTTWLLFEGSVHLQTQGVSKSFWEKLRNLFTAYFSLKFTLIEYL